MAFVENLVGLDKVFEDELATRNLMMDMRVDERILQSLGEVIAVDIFIGNEDRFTPTAGEILDKLSTRETCFSNQI